MGPLIVRVAGVAVITGLLLAAPACGRTADEPSGTPDDIAGDTPSGDAVETASEAGQSPPGQRCPAGPVDNYLDAQWQWCWFEEGDGHWRRIEHTLHYTILVVQAEATNLDLAEAIARRFVEQHAERFPDEILVYVRSASADTRTMVRRVTWSPARGYQFLDFDTGNTAADVRDDDVHAYGIVPVADGAVG